MSKYSFFYFLLITITLNAQNSAPSCHLTANDQGAGDILIKTVRSTITTDATYYCTMQWNAGAEGGAYCGFQDSPDKGNIFIYSIWDPSNGQPITAPHVGSGTIVENFGGEGTGLKSYNNTIGWSLNEWNTVVTRRWAVGNHTHFGFWVRRGSQNRWYHLVTMDYPVANVFFNGTTNSFLEDWLSTGSNKRRFEQKDGFKRSTNGNWIPMSQATFNRNNEPRSSNYTNAVDAGISQGSYYMQSGGNSTPSYSGNPPITFQNNPGTSPSNPAIAFSISSASTNNISWQVPVSSTPQFRYTVKVNGVTVATGINPQQRNASISASTGSAIEVILEDILGRTTSHTTTLSLLTNGTYAIYARHSNKVLDVANGGNNNGDNILQWAYHGGNNQRWNLTNLGNNTYQIINVNSGQSIDIGGGSMSNGANALQWAHHGGNNQRWVLEPVGGSYYHIRAQHSNKCLNISNNSTSNGANVHQWDCGSAQNDDFRFVHLNSNNVAARNNTTQNLDNAIFPTSTLQINPNPTSNTLNINLNLVKENKSGRMILMDIQGKIIEEHSFKPLKGLHEISLDVSNRSSGLYFLQIQTDHEQLAKQVIIK